MICEGEKGAAEDAGDATEDQPGPAVGGMADAVADDEGAGDGDETGGGVEEGGVGGREAEVSDEGGGVCGYYAA